MIRPTLYIGTRHWSSWSLRPWLALTVGGIRFDEVLVPLREHDSSEAVRRVSPSGLVPVLRLGETMIWDSLAICEWAAEQAPSLWPADATRRAVARSVAAEMHSGFAALRAACPMAIGTRAPRPDPLPASVQADLERIGAVWRACREAEPAGGPFLFGAFSVADAMYAPVATRFVTYDLPRDAVAGAYIDSIMALPAMATWAKAGAAAAGG